MKHKNAEMIIAKANNTELAVFVKVVDSQNESGSYWAPSSLSTLSIAENEFFLCLPQHKEVCLHWLNGGDIQVLDSNWINVHPVESYPWEDEHDFMCEDSKIRIKPKKEKRWIAVNPDGYVLPIHADSKESIRAHASSDTSRLTLGVQFIEIEVEV
ncbi:hypothetical protein NVP1276O_70 [Vibrio phage 1.276.O._10N.286.54.E4]|nr:hypothetical protein NVP1276O_70 [Vibrio phage 1.276.O._10N.286.54.E4]